MDPPVQSQQPVGVKTRQPGAGGLQGRTDRLQANEQPLPEVGDALRVGWNERQLRTSGQRFPKPHPGMKAERPGSGASAVGPCSSSARSPAAIVRAKRGMRTQMITGANICSHLLRMDTPQGAMLALSSERRDSATLDPHCGPHRRPHPRPPGSHRRRLLRPGRRALRGCDRPVRVARRFLHGRSAGPVADREPDPVRRSTNNYPSDVTRTLAPSSFTDASCSSATTADMTQSQSLEDGLQTAPPQFNALRSTDALVTLGIGGNDAGLISVAKEGAKLDLFSPLRTACKNHYDSGGSDPNVAAINATKPKVAAVIQGIHQRAAQSKVMVVGYPDALPVNGSECWPLVPISAGDIKYFNSLEQQLNQVLQQAAQANGATYVDTFASSVGHDACKSPGVAWVNGIIPTSPAFPLHPNQTGEQNMANQVLADY